MFKLMKQTVLAAIFAGLAMNAAMAGEKLTEDEARAIIQPFYDFLSHKGSVEAAAEVFSDGWKSYNGRDMYREKEANLGFLAGPLAKMVPDMNLEILSVSVTDKNEIVVRGEITGTPAGEHFFGQPVSGKSFKIMNIDVHTVENGKIVKSYHLEDWAGALRQLAQGS